MAVKIIGNRIIKDSGSPAYSDMTSSNGLLGTFSNDFRGWVWQDNSTNKVYEWNYATGNAGSWDFLYNLGETGGGLAKLSGANFVGAVTAPEIASVNSPAFIGTVTISGQQVATQTYVTLQVDSLASTISQLVNQAIASAGSSAGTSTNIGHFGYSYFRIMTYRRINGKTRTYILNVILVKITIAEYISYYNSFFCCIKSITNRR